MKLEQIKDNSTIKLEISTAFYRRLQHLVLFQQSMFDEETLIQAHQNFVNDKELSEQEELLQTALILCGSIEVAAGEPILFVIMFILIVVYKTRLRTFKRILRDTLRNINNLN